MPFCSTDKLTLFYNFVWKGVGDLGCLQAGGGGEEEKRVRNVRSDCFEDNFWSKTMSFNYLLPISPGLCRPDNGCNDKKVTIDKTVVTGDCICY